MLSKELKDKIIDVYLDYTPSILRENNGVYTVETPEGDYIYNSENELIEDIINCFCEWLSLEVIA